MFIFKYYVEDGGLISYGIDIKSDFQRLAEYVAKILNGAKPAELPVQTPTKYETTLNLKTAKALGLTEREVTILGALARGLSNDQIAKEFWVAPQTVKFHLTNIYRKLGVKNRTEATRIAYQHGLVESPIYADE